MRRIVSAVASLALGSTAFAAVNVDFENAPALFAVPDNAPVSNEFLADFGVEFSILSGTTAADAVPGLPTIEAVGGDTDDGFVNDEFNARDIESEGSLGEYFLKAQGDVVDTGFVQLNIDFADPTNFTRGEIWDIDGTNPNNTEQWVVRGLDASGAVIDSLISPLGDSNTPDSLDGKAWNWALAGDGIVRVEIEFIGSKTRGVGLAFDNFVVPEPASLLTLALGGLLLRRR